MDEIRRSQIKYVVDELAPLVHLVEGLEYAERCVSGDKPASFWDGDPAGRKNRYAMDRLQSAVTDLLNARAGLKEILEYKDKGE